MQRLRNHQGFANDPYSRAYQASVNDFAAGEIAMAQYSSQELDEEVAREIAEYAVWLGIDPHQDEGRAD